MNEKIPRLRMTVEGTTRAQRITWFEDTVIHRDEDKIKDSLNAIRTVIKICGAPVKITLQGAFKNDAEAFCFSDILAEGTIKLLDLKHLSISKKGENAILAKLPPNTYVTGNGYREPTPRLWASLTKAFSSKTAAPTERTPLFNNDVELSAVKPK